MVIYEITSNSISKISHEGSNSEGKMSSITTMKLFPNNVDLIVGYEDGTIRLWNISKKAVKLEISFG